MKNILFKEEYLSDQDKYNTEHLTFKDEIKEFNM